MARLVLENTTEEAWNQDEGTPGCFSEGALQRSALEEHARKNHHPIKWKDVTVINCTRAATTAEGGHPHLLHSSSLNRDEGIELPKCWMAALKAAAETAAKHSTTSAGATFCDSAWWMEQIYEWQVANLPSPWKRPVHLIKTSTRCVRIKSWYLENQPLSHAWTSWAASISLVSLCFSHDMYVRR